LDDALADISWGELIERRPDLSESGKALLYQFSVGLEFLSTVRRDGGPRVHPVCPLLTDSGIYAFIVPSPKCDDLRRDRRFALHSYPTDDNEDAFYLTGIAYEVDDPEVRERIAHQFLAERAGIDLGDHPLSEQTLFEFRVASCLLTRTDGHGDPNPRHEIWHAS